MNIDFPTADFKEQRNLLFQEIVRLVANYQKQRQDQIQQGTIHHLPRMEALQDHAANILFKNQLPYSEALDQLRRYVSRQQLYYLTEMGIDQLELVPQHHLYFQSLTELYDKLDQLKADYYQTQLQTLTQEMEQLNQPSRKPEQRLQELTQLQKKITALFEDYSKTYESSRLEDSVQTFLMTTDGLRENVAAKISEVQHSLNAPLQKGFTTFGHTQAPETKPSQPETAPTPTPPRKS